MASPGRAVIVGNSDGIGRALTRRLLDQGWTVTGLSRSPLDLPGERYTHHVVDVTDPGYPEVVRAAGDMDLCVYAAGIGDLVAVPELTGQSREFEVNLLGAVRTCEVVVPGMVAVGRGHVIGLSSLADAMPSREAPAYNASKAGLTTYLIGLRAAVRDHGVRVSTIRFGFVDTKMAKSPVRPMLVPVEKAVDVVLDCVRTGAGVVSYPRRLSLMAGLAANAVRRGLAR